VAGSSLSVEDISDDIVDMQARIDQLVEPNPQHAAMIRQLERAYDESLEAMAGGDTGLGPDLPSGDDLAEELQRFLREQGD
ncbi:MAG TPA: hypothetical protein VFU14_15275, partial [Acidimicrobiales bacterium]|nr:hypothetical protein [Acidimicrobiales bacterium]